MSTLIAIPVRGTMPSKTRLAPLFDEEQRAILVRSMLEHMLSQMPVGTDVAVITRSPEFLLDLSPTVEVIEQAFAYAGLNGSLQQALNHASKFDYKELLMLPGDLPLLAEHEVTSLLLEEGRMVLVGDRDHEGTNGLRLPTAWADEFEFAMGLHSFAHHIAEAQRLGTVPVTVYHRGLAHDLDTPDDWLALPENVRECLSERMQMAAKGV